MSPNSHRGAMVVGPLDLTPGLRPAPHDHATHQLAWAPRGVLAVRTGSAEWVLPPTRALWLPARTRHRTATVGHATLFGVYAHPARSPVSWPTPTLVTVGPLLRELLVHLADDAMADAERARAEAVVFDLLKPAGLGPIAVPSPSDARARAVAAALRADPADPRTLAEFGWAVGAGERTLARIFSEECGMGFGRWRTRFRMNASLPLLAERLPLEAVARRVGYSSASAYVAAFRQTAGVTPGAYFAARPQDPTSA